MFTKDEKKTTIEDLLNNLPSGDWVNQYSLFGNKLTPEDQEEEEYSLASQLVNLLEPTELATEYTRPYIEQICAADQAHRTNGFTRQHANDQDFHSWLLENAHQLTPELLLEAPHRPEQALSLLLMRYILVTERQIESNDQFPESELSDDEQLNSTQNLTDYPITTSIAIKSSLPDVLPHVRGIQESRSVRSSLDSADKPRDDGSSLYSMAEFARKRIKDLTDKADALLDQFNEGPDSRLCAKKRQPR